MKTLTVIIIAFATIINIAAAKNPTNEQIAKLFGFNAEDYTNLLQDRPVKACTLSYKINLGCSGFQGTSLCLDGLYSYGLFEKTFKAEHKKGQNRYEGLLNCETLNKFVDYCGSRVVSNWEEPNDDAVKAITAFVQQGIAYDYSKKTAIGKDRFLKHPVKTLLDGKGFCEDKVLLLYYFLKRLGYGVCLVDFPNHTMVGLQTTDQYGTIKNNGNFYCLIETTDKVAIGIASKTLKKDANNRTYSRYTKVPTIKEVRLAHGQETILLATTGNIFRSFETNKQNEIAIFVNK
ncbi:MAG: hypothetical protein PHR00_00500 [Patescibacteria group bacterium]|nr:hypothetical protein [Patescibacteria group bacterium]